MDFLVTEAFGQTWLCRRHDFQRHRNAGVPPMDVFDPHCVSVAIVLCEQAPATVLEVSARISLECVGKGPLVVVGPGAKVLLMERRVESPCRITVLPGQTVVVEAPTLGQRTILATPKGWMPPVPFGAANCQSIRPGQKLISQSEGKERKDLRLDSELLAFNKVLRVIGGENLPEKWTVLADSDRRGIRLVSDQMVEGLPGLSTSRPCIVGTCQ